MNLQSSDRKFIKVLCIGEYGQNIFNTLTQLDVKCLDEFCFEHINSSENIDYSNIIYDIDLLIVLTEMNEKDFLTLVNLFNELSFMENKMSIVMILPNEDLVSQAKEQIGLFYDYPVCYLNENKNNLFPKAKNYLDAINMTFIKHGNGRLDYCDLSTLLTGCHSNDLNVILSQCEPENITNMLLEVKEKIRELYISPNNINNALIFIYSGDKLNLRYCETIYDYFKDMFSKDAIKISGLSFLLEENDKIRLLLILD